MKGVHLQEEIEIREITEEEVEEETGTATVIGIEIVGQSKAEAAVEGKAEASRGVEEAAVPAVATVMIIRGMQTFTLLMLTTQPKTL